VPCQRKTQKQGISGKKLDILDSRNLPLGHAWTDCPFHPKTNRITWFFEVCESVDSEPPEGFTQKQKHAFLTQIYGLATGQLWGGNHV